MNKILLFMFLLITVTCINKKGPVAIKALIDNDNVVTLALNNLDVQPVKMDSLLEIVAYIKPEATDRSLIAEYSKIIVKQDKIFILDKNMSNMAIFVFDMKGKLLFKINKRGHGPGEYNSLEDFYVDEKNEIIGVLDHSQILKYDFKGSFIEKLDLRLHFVSNIVAVDSLIYTYTFSQCLSKNCYSFKIFNQKGNLVYEDMPVRRDLIFSPLTGMKHNNLFIDFKNKVYLNTIHNDTVYEVALNRISPKYIADFGKHKLPDNMFSDFVKHGDKVNYSSVFNSDYVLFGLNNIYFTKDYSFFDFIGNKRSYMVFFSKQTGLVKIVQEIQAQQMPPSNFVAADENFFYALISASESFALKNQFEELGILNSNRNFSDNIKTYYNAVLKDLKEEDNHIIIACKLKDF